MEKVNKVVTGPAAHYVKDNVLRYVVNYDYCFKTFTKQRWIGKNLLDMFIAEFKAFTEQYYVR